MFKDRLVELRKKNKLTQEKLAKKLSISRPTLARYETGDREPDFNMLLKISEILHVSTDFLLGKDDNNETKKPPAIGQPQTPKILSVEELLAQQGITDEEHIASLKKIMDLMAMNERNTELSKEFNEREYSVMRKA